MRCHFCLDELAGKQPSQLAMLNHELLTVGVVVDSRAGIVSCSSNNDQLGTGFETSMAVAS